MKKISIFLLAISAAVSVSAQYNNNNRNQNNNGYGDKKEVVVYHDNRNDDHSNGRINIRERDMKVAAINRDYDSRIREVRNRFFMSRFKKEQQINWLEAQRNQEIKRVFGSYERRDDRDSRNHW